MVSSVTLASMAEVMAASPDAIGPVREEGGGRRGVHLAVGLMAVLMLVMAASLFVGARPTAVSEVWTALQAGPGAEGDLGPVVWSMRMPRMVLAVAAGGALAIGGALAQVWTRNSLADPGIIGITAGAGFAVALGVTVWHAGPAARTLWGLAGAAGAAAITLFAVRGSRNPMSLILVGTGVSASLSALTTILALYTMRSLEAMRHWTVGTTVGKGTDDIRIAVAGLVLGSVLAAWVARPMDLASMGDDVARGLGVDPDRTRVLAGAAIIVLAGSATAAVGPVAFVGLAAPHIARALAGGALVRLLPVVFLVGALLTLAADMLGRVVARPGELEVSLVLALLGAPLLIAVVRAGKVVLS